MRCIFMSGKSKIQQFNSNIEKLENKGREQILLLIISTLGLSMKRNLALLQFSIMLLPLR